MTQEQKLIEQSATTEKEMKKGKLRLGETTNPYWVFLQVTSRGVPKEIFECMNWWSSFHENWYNHFLLEHKKLSGLGEKQKQAFMKRWKESKAWRDMDDIFGHIFKAGRRRESDQEVHGVNGGRPC